MGYPTKRINVVLMLSLVAIKGMLIMDIPLVIILNTK